MTIAEAWKKLSLVGACGLADLDGDGTVERMPLFDDRLQDYYWQYDNNWLRVVQLRFYEQPTNIN
jgi:hypothetical protein